MRAGKLDRPVVLQRMTETVSPVGTVSTAWTTLGELRAELVTLATDEAGKAYGEASSTVALLRTRYLAGLSIADRIVLDGDFYNIRNIAEIGRRRGLELKVERAE